MKQYVMSYRNYEIYLDSSYNCPRLSLYGFASDSALIRAINRKLSPRRTSIRLNYGMA